MNVNKVAHWLLIIGGLNWLLEAFRTGLTSWLPWNVATIVYVVIGLAAIYKLFSRHQA